MYWGMEPPYKKYNEKGPYKQSIITNARWLYKWVRARSDLLYFIMYVDTEPVEHTFFHHCYILCKPLVS